MSLLQEAGLNTLLGMGMTFLVLLALSLIISLFGKILSGRGKPEKREKGTGRKDGPGKGDLSQNNDAGRVSGRRVADAGDTKCPDGFGMPAGTSMSQKEESYISPETAAVIAAAIAAYEGKAGPGGLEVRQIRKSRKHVA